MGFLDALQDTVTIYASSVAYKAGDTVGQQVKTETALYSGIKGRLQAVSEFEQSRADAGKMESFKNRWTLIVAPQYNGADRGDTALVNGLKFLITKKHEVRGRTSAIHHVYYSLEEKQ